jgi:hypothetical protein
MERIKNIYITELGITDIRLLHLYPALNIRYVNFLYRKKINARQSGHARFGNTLPSTRLC